MSTLLHSRLTLFSRYVLLTLALFVLLVVVFIIYVRAEKQIDRAHDLRHQSFLLADELRQSSDDLTRMVRTYVVTGNPACKQYYLAILAIRDGKQPRPRGYQHSYWDLVLAGDIALDADVGPAIALLELMREAGFTDAEFRKLAESKANSDRLTNTEFEAMHLVEMTGPDPESDRAQARSLLFDAQYLQAKAGIMKPINEFYELMDQRTLAAVNTAVNNAMVIRVILSVFGLSLLLLVLRIQQTVRTTMGGTVDEVFAYISRIGRGDFSAHSPVTDLNHDSVMGWLAQTQNNLQEIELRHQAAELALKDSKEWFQFIFNATSEGIWVRDAATGAMLDVNERMLEMYGYSHDEALACDAGALSLNVEPYTHKGANAIIERAATEGPQIFEWHSRRKDGSLFWTMHSLRKVSYGKKSYIIIAARDNSERRQMEEQVKQLAFYDTLTNLPNRRLLSDRLSQTMSASARGGDYGAVLFLDLDNFKPINDLHGHAAGDLLLVEVAQRLIHCVRESDTVARFGGDEFVVVLSGLHADKIESTALAAAVAEKIRSALSEPYHLPIKHQASADVVVEHHCAVSIGVALFLKREPSQEEILKRADAAMYQAKQAGRNSIRFFSEPT